jgi:hypothetical protein
MSKDTRTNLSGVKSAVEAMETANLLWPVEDQSLLTGAGKSVDTHKALVRGDTGAVLGVGNIGDTAWDLYNGVTEHVDLRNSTAEEDKRINSALFGSGATLKSKAFDAALAL